MKYHLILLLIFSVLTSIVLTYIAKNNTKERIKYFLFLLASFVASSIVAGWLMYPFPF
jgi:cytochrome bd-type quinol oxidase subunit 2